MADWLGLQAIVEEYRRKKELEAWQAAHPNVPPLNVMPQTDPVSALKNKVALSNKLTPEAARILYNTPTSVGFHPQEAQDAMAGYYDPPTGASPLAQRINSTLNPWQKNLPVHVLSDQPDLTAAEILMHEFTHKWDFEQTPLNKQADWRTNWRKEASPSVLATVAGRSDPITPSVEAYAHQAQNGPMGMPEAMRGYYYPGLFQSGLGPMNTPPPFQPPADPTPYTARVLPWALNPDQSWQTAPQGGQFNMNFYDQPGPWPWPNQQPPPRNTGWPSLDFYNFQQDARGG